MATEWNPTSPRILGLLFVTTTILLCGPVSVVAAPPPPPESYYGTVIINGNPAPNGVEVTAKIEGETKDSITVTDEGRYGGSGAFEEKLVVNGSENATVHFYIAGLDSGTTDSLTPGEVTELNLSVTDTEEPVANTQADIHVTPDTTVHFNGSNSSDNGQIIRYEWDFTDDGTIDATGIAPTFAYENPGTYQVTLTVEDAGGNTDNDTRQITVEEEENDQGGGNENSGSQTTTTSTQTTTSSNTRTSTHTTTQSSTTPTTSKTEQPTTSTSSTTTVTTQTTSTTKAENSTNTQTQTVNESSGTTEDPTTSPTVTQGENEGATNTTSPGFEVVSGLIAIIFAGLLATRRR